MAQVHRTLFSGQYRHALVPIIIPPLLILQTAIYINIYEFRPDYDYINGFLYLAMVALVYALILFFQRSIQKPLPRLTLQLGWMLLLFIAMHTALIQFVDRNIPYPYAQGALVSFLTAFHESTNVVIALGVILSVIGVYSWVMDFSARERRFYSVVAAMPVGVAVIDQGGQIVLHNEALTGILGLAGNEIDGSRLSDLFNMENQVLKSEMGPEPYGPIQLDIVYEREGSPRKYLSVHIVSNKDEAGNVVGHILVVSDITARRMAEDEREQQRRVIGLYASLLSHDIGNDLQAVLGYLEGTSMLLKDDVVTAEKMLKSAEAAGQRMANLVRTFRAESAPAHILVIEMLKQVARVAETVSMGMTVHVEAAPSTTSLKSPGGTLLPIAFENLLRNAGQHAGRTPTVTIRTERENDKLVVTVSDDGPGIPVEMRRFLFNRSDPKKETGLGLYLTKQIITACGGTIELDPDGPGAAFRIVLPIIE